MILSNALSLSPPLYLKKNTTETALGNLFLLKLTNVCSVSLMLKQMIRNEFILTSCACVCVRISVMILSNALSLSLPLYLKKNTTETALGNLFLLKLSNVCSVSLMLKQMIRN